MEGKLSEKEKSYFLKRLDTLDSSMVRILSILEADEKIGEKGLVKTVREIEEKLSELLTREKVYKSKATTWGIIGGAVSAVLIWVLKFAITKLII